MLQNHTTRWTVEEIAHLTDLWDGHRETTEVIAELLGRTPDAVQQKFYELSWGAAPKPVITKNFDPAQDMHATPSRRKSTLLDSLMLGEAVCPNCFMVVPPTGVCGTCD
jgi:hypothetical protein